MAPTKRYSMGNRLVRHGLATAAHPRSGNFSGRGSVLLLAMLSSCKVRLLSKMQDVSRGEGRTGFIMKVSHNMEW